MKKLTYFLILLAIIFLISSCCYKKDCISGMGPIQLNNFTIQEADSIAIISYQQNTNYTVKIDSFFTSASGNSSPILIPFTSGLSLDYKIIFINIGRVYLLNNFSFKKKICDPCLFWGTYYDALDGYEINGQKQDIPVQISK